MMIITQKNYVVTTLIFVVNTLAVKLTSNISQSRLCEFQLTGLELSLYFESFKRFCTLICVEK